MDGCRVCDPAMRPSDGQQYVCSEGAGRPTCCVHMGEGAAAGLTIKAMINQLPLKPFSTVQLPAVLSLASQVVLDQAELDELAISPR